MKVELHEHTVDQQTQWGTVKKSLNQHKVFLHNEEADRMVHCGYVGTNAFLPLCGFPAELIEPVRVACEEHLGRSLLAADAPPTMAKVQAMIDGAAGAANADDDMEDDDE